jgi:hypothetical protein
VQTVSYSNTRRAIAIYQHIKAHQYEYANEKWHFRALTDASYDVRDAYATESGAEDHDACIKLTAEEVIARVETADKRP